MGLPVIFRTSALADIEGAYHWYEEKQPGLGSSFMAELGKSEELVSSNPRLFAPVRGDVRRAILHKFPYGLFYIVQPEFISVIAVLDHARHPSIWQSRQ